VLTHSCIQVAPLVYHTAPLISHIPSLMHHTASLMHHAASLMHHTASLMHHTAPLVLRVASSVVVRVGCSLVLQVLVGDDPGLPVLLLLDDHNGSPLVRVALVTCNGQPIGPGFGDVCHLPNLPGL